MQRLLVIHVTMKHSCGSGLQGWRELSTLWKSAKRKAEGPGGQGDSIPLLFPGERGPLGQGSSAPSPSHCGSASSSAAVASTW